VAYPISYRQLEEMMEEHGVEVDHATLNRWVLKYVPLLDQEFRVRKRPVGSSWRMDETYVRVKGAWKYLYRAVDKAGTTVDFLLSVRPITSRIIGITCDSMSVVRFAGAARCGRTRIAVSMTAASYGIRVT
jgi:hypothetical protein